MNTPSRGPVESSESKIQVLKIIWIGLSLSAPIYALVLYRLFAAAASDPSADPGVIPDSVAPLRYAAILPAMISTGLFLSRLTPSRLVERFKRQTPEQAVQSAFPIYVVCWILNDVVAVLGFTYCFLVTRNVSSYAPYLVGTLALNLAMFPRLNAPLRQAQRDRELMGNSRG